MNVLKLLSGKKTYILAGGGIVVVAGYMLGLLDKDTADTALAALGFGSVATLRVAIAKQAASQAAGTDQGQG